jgi:hypothetical protein
MDNVQAVFSSWWSGNFLISGEYLYINFKWLRRLLLQVYLEIITKCYSESEEHYITFFLKETLYHFPEKKLNRLEVACSFLLKELN